MADGAEKTTADADEEPEFAEEIGRSATRKLHARREEEKRPVWSGLGLMGMVGWSVAVPTVVGVFLGRWLDSRAAGGEVRSWTLVMLAAGLALGCANAWRWVARENAYNRDLRKRNERKPPE